MTFKILRVKKTNVYDVFSGEGWENWTRIAITSRGCDYVKGKRLRPNQVKELYNLVTKKGE
jgi:hypothetical protein